jgi:asparagine synthase (glutamine-hydrolysing)
MSFQAGIVRLDGRSPGEAESSTIQAWVRTAASGPVASKCLAEACLAHSSSVVNGRNCAATFDGRLDNREELRQRLRDAVSGDAVDAALALAAWEMKGTAGLAELIGDFSLAIWDAAKKSLLLASDYAGVRPLYYAVEPDRVLWSTRLRPLVEYLRPRDLDDEYVAGIMTAGGCPHHTPYRGIRSVPPGHAVTIAGGKTGIARFWHLPLEETIRYSRDEEYAEQLLALFREAVRARIPGEANCLCDLSGGLDSSSVVCIASDLIRSGDVTPAKFATVTVEHEGSRDTPFYRAVEERCGFEAIHLAASEFPFLTAAATGGALPGFWESLQKQIAGLAREAGVTTYLTGKFGDEIMGNWGDDSDQVAGLLRRGRPLRAIEQAVAWSKCMRVPAAWILWRAIRSNLPMPLQPSYEHDISAWREGPADEEDSIAPAFRKRVDLDHRNRFLSRDWKLARPERRRCLRSLTSTVELRRLQTPEVFEHLDYTHPYMHRPLVDFMLSIPADVVCRPGEPRRLMRRAFREMWPRQLQSRRSKDTFGTVFLDSLRPLARELLKHDKPLQLVERGYADRASLTSRLERLSSSIKCNERQLRYLILFEFWLRHSAGGMLS